ncbi:MAG: aspartate--tRNA ligase [Elusimicrobia bacterium]|nr:aspartate--tRNA ligase [Candidatus Liberimonas magnetica]
MKRTNYCGSLRQGDIGKEVTLCGWVHSRRDHGGVIFIDLRDREGLAQIVFQPEEKEIFAAAEKIRNEFVLAVTGLVRQRPAGTENPNMQTGQVEVVVDELEVINKAPALPFEISDYTETSEEMRLKYRYLDLRRPNVAKNFILRHKILQEVHQYLSKEGFLEVETPFLTKSTPEGARDFLVPSRLNPDHFFALPQSPQLFKQILMVAGFDKYFQVVRCFRDEDLRADRQPEFTQIDLEMSFVDEEDVMSVIEGLVADIFKNALNIELKVPFRRLPYSEAMMRFGSDKPDLRFGMEIADLTQELKACGFKVFSGAIEKGGVARGICVPGGDKFSRSEIDELTKFAAIYGAKGLAWMKVTDKGPESNIVKFFSAPELEAIQKKLGAKAGDLLLFLADNEKIVATGLGALRLKLGNTLKLIPKEEFNFLWVVDFPLFEWDSEEKRWNAMHHPFTSPKEEDIHLLSEQSKAGAMRARAYDIVLNGVELGGGSIRIHKEEVQEKLFSMLNISQEEAKEKFGFLLEALSFGAPPHGGIALGFDRLCALLLGEESIREVIAFPKTQKGICPLSEAPGVVAEKQLKELNIKSTVIKPA